MHWCEGKFIPSKPIDILQKLYKARVREEGIMMTIDIGHGVSLGKRDKFCFSAGCRRSDGGCDSTA